MSALRSDAAREWGVDHLPAPEALAQLRLMREEITDHGGAERLPFTAAELEQLDALIQQLAG